MRREGEGGEPTFDWGSLVPLLVHPAKVAIIEALLWVERPLSPTEIVRLLGNEREYYLSLVSYHTVSLAKVGVIKKVRTRSARGALEKFYYFPKQ
jgi:hypothetical protein